jgi:hypothetical protein
LLGAVAFSTSLNRDSMAANCNSVSVSKHIHYTKVDTHTDKTLECIR